MSQNPNKKVLVFRLSSLGDIILSTSALQTPLCSGGVDWVVSREFAGLLQGHPKIRRLFEFDRLESGFSEWVGLCRELHAEGYDEILDLHLSLRTRIARVLFFFWGSRARWRVISKYRMRTYAYLVFKKLWPKAFRPVLAIDRFVGAAGGLGTEKPDMSHLVDKVSRLEPALLPVLPLKPFICVMPSAQWSHKRWATERYLETIRSAGFFPVILGTASDKESVALVEMLKREGISHSSGVGLWSIDQTAYALSKSFAYLGNDTGLAHLAEAVGTRAVVIYGSTSPDILCGPWRAESRAVYAGISCSPCGTYGKHCYRPKQKDLCLKSVSSGDVVAALGGKTRDQS